jgi:hypothetical protein
MTILTNLEGRIALWQSTVVAAGRCFGLLEGGAPLAFRRMSVTENYGMNFPGYDNSNYVKVVLKYLLFDPVVAQAAGTCVL